MPDAFTAPTPAPWLSDEYGDTTTNCVIGDNGHHVVCKGNDLIENPHDRRLILAAPELLASCIELREALAALMRQIVDSDDFDEINDGWGSELAAAGIANGFGLRAADAIKKAKGE